MIAVFKKPGVIAGLCAFAGAMSLAFHKPALAAFLSDPDTATTMTGIVTGAVAIIAGVLKGIKE